MPSLRRRYERKGKKERRTRAECTQYRTVHNGGHASGAQQRIRLTGPSERGCAGTSVGAALDEVFTAVGVAVERGRCYGVLRSREPAFMCEVCTARRWTGIRWGV